MKHQHLKFKMKEKTIIQVTTENITQIIESGQKKRNLIYCYNNGIKH